jgi:predicted NBD/HSP70 family sugar kinase
MRRLIDNILTILLIPVILIGGGVKAILHLLEIIHIKVNSLIRDLRKSK